jgi:hypothetical protein
VKYSRRWGIIRITKAKILEEIKRTAAANDGKALGIARFKRETGITSWDWLKFWPRFSEAIREAGYTPSVFSTGHDEAELLREYVAFVRELGRIPSRGELIVRSYAKPGFPCYRTFYRWGEQPKLIERVATYCRTQSGLEDVLGLCAAYTPRRPGYECGSNGEKLLNGFVYLIKSGRFYKIGKTNAPGRREYELAVQLPHRAVQIHTIETDDPIGVESYWHNRFRDKRRNGEWFLLCIRDVRAFRKWKKIA